MMYSCYSTYTYPPVARTTANQKQCYFKILQGWSLALIHISCIYCIRYKYCFLHHSYYLVRKNEKLIPPSFGGNLLKVCVLINEPWEFRNQFPPVLSILNLLYYIMIILYYILDIYVAFAFALHFFFLLFLVVEVSCLCNLLRVK